MRKSAHWQKPIDKRDRVSDIVECLNTQKDDIELLEKGLYKLTRSELETLYYTIRNIR